MSGPVYAHNLTELICFQKGNPLTSELLTASVKACVTFTSTAGKVEVELELVVIRLVVVVSALVVVVPRSPL